MKVLLAESTWQEVKQQLAQDPVIVIPTGSIEQHGPHLPLMVDSLLAYRVAELAALRAVSAGSATMVTPPIWTGYSPHHMEFAGSVTLSSTTYAALLTDVARSLHHHGFRRLLFLNGHGGNTNLVRSAVQALRFEHGIHAATANYWDLALSQIAEWRKSPTGGINHACEFETSLMMALRGDLVEEELIEDHLPRASSFTSPDLTEGGSVTLAASFGSQTPSGVLGAPSLASKQRGEEVLSAVVAAVAEFLHAFKRAEAAPNGDWLV